MITFYTYINKSRFEKEYHFGWNSITIDKFIPSFKTLGACINGLVLRHDNPDEVIILQLESEEDQLLHKALNSLSCQNGELSFKVIKKWEINSF